MKLSKFIFTLFAGASLISSCSVPNSGTKSDAFGYSNNSGRIENKAEVANNNIQPVQPTGYTPTDNAQNVQPVNSATEPTYYDQNAGDATAGSQSYVDQNDNPGTVINNYYGYSAPVADNYYDRYYGPYAPGFSISIGVDNYYYRPYYNDNVFWRGYYWPRHNSRVIYYPSYCYSDPYMYDYPNYNYWFWGGYNPNYSNYYYNPYYNDYYHNHNNNYYGNHESTRNQSSRSFGAGRTDSDRPVGVSNTPGSGVTNDRRTSGQSGTGSGRIVSGGIQPGKDAVTSSNNRRTVSSESVKNTGQAVNVPTNNESNGRKASTTNSTNTINTNGRTALNANARSINSGNSKEVTKSEKVRNSTIKVDGKPVSENNTGNTRRSVINSNEVNVNQNGRNSQRKVEREESRRSEPQREVRREESTRVSTPRSEPARSEPVRSEPARSSTPSNSGSSNESNRRR